MAEFIYYNEAPVSIQGKSVCARSASMNSNNSLQPNYELGRRSPRAAVASDRVRGSLSLDYIISDGGDPILALTGDANGLPIEASGSVGTVAFEKAYLSSLSVRGEPNQVVSANAGFELFADFGDDLSALQGSDWEGSVGHGSNSAIQGSSAIGINLPISFSYEVSLTHAPYYTLGELNVTGVERTDGSISMTIEGEDIGDNLTLCGTDAILSVDVKDLCSNDILQTYSVSGKITQRQLDVSANEAIRGTITVVQFI